MVIDFPNPNRLVSERRNKPAKYNISIFRRCSSEANGRSVLSFITRGGDCHCFDNFDHSKFYNYSINDNDDERKCHGSEFTSTGCTDISSHARPTHQRQCSPREGEWEEEKKKKRGNHPHSTNVLPPPASPCFPLGSRPHLRPSPPSIASPLLPQAPLPSKRRAEEEE